MRMVSRERKVERDPRVICNGCQGTGYGLERKAPNTPDPCKRCGGS
ncbi:hypothetical protein LCGC14_2537650, partial [marine sediment metagenome]